MAIHPRSEIDPTAVIADNVSIGPWVTVGAGSVIESGVEIASSVVIGPWTTLREGVRVYPGAIIGTDPQDIKYDGTPTRCEIGPRTVVREYATINRGTKASGLTSVGSDSYIMTYAHVAHDCRIGNHVVMANNVGLAGHCVIEDHAVMGGHSTCHQFVRVGTLAMVGGVSGLRLDAPPYMTTFGYPPAKVYGVNTVGLKRSTLSSDACSRIKTAYRLLYRSGLNFSEALQKLEEQFTGFPEIDHLIEFYRKTKRGVSRGASANGVLDSDAELSEETLPATRAARGIVGDVNDS